MKFVKSSFLLLGIYLTFFMLGFIWRTKVVGSFPIDALLMFWGGCLWWHIASNEDKK